MDGTPTDVYIYVCMMYCHLSLSSYNNNILVIICVCTIHKCFVAIMFRSGMTFPDQNYIDESIEDGGIERERESGRIILAIGGDDVTLPDRRNDRERERRKKRKYTVLY